MDPTLLEYLACPMDLQSPLEMQAQSVGQNNEIIEGIIHCPNCSTNYPIRETIPILLPNPESSDNNFVQHWKSSEQNRRDKEASLYDSRIPKSLLLVDYFGLTQHLNLNVNHVLLDLGCGTGRLTMKIAQMVNKIIGVDFSFESLYEFRERISPNLVNRVHLVQADIFHLPLKDQVFDRVVSNSVLQHVPGLIGDSSPISEVARVLSKNGIFTFSIYNYSSVRAFFAKVFPAITYGGGYKREGFHDNSIYFHRYEWREIYDLLGLAFDIDHIGGMRIVPKEILQHGGEIAQSVEKMLQRFKISRNLGYYLLVSAKKEAKERLRIG